MNSRPGVLAVVLMSLAMWFAMGLAGAPALAADWDVARLMRSLAQQRGGKVYFTEKKYIALLDRPVESSGELVFVPPSRLERRTLKPTVESMVLDRDVLEVERAKQKYTLQLQQYPEIAAIVDSIRKTLAGDLAALERQYRVELLGSPDRWTLTLLPSDSRIAAVVQKIQISGTGNELRQIEMLLADGDRSVMQIRREPSP